MPTRTLPFAALILSLSLVACGGGDSPSAHTRQRPPQPVVVTEVQQGPLTGVRTVSGHLDALRRVKIFNEEGGRIVSLPWHEGDRVRQGELLVRIDDSLIQAELRKARANLQQARSDRRRLESLFRRKLVSEEDISRADTAIELAASEVSQLETRLTRTRIRAPFDAIVTERRIEPGDVAPTHTHLLTLIDPARLEAVVYVSERLLFGLEKATPVTLRIDALGDRPIRGEVLRLTPRVDTRTLKARVEIALPGQPGALPGQLVRADLPVRTSSRLHVPFAAVRHDSHGAYVWRLTGENTVTKARVVTGLQLGERIAVREGLAPGERIVIKGFVGLREGRKVEVRNDA